MPSKVRSEGSVDILEVGGDIGALNMVRVKNRMAKLIKKERTKVILDLRRARHIDFAGLGILVERLRRVRALNGDLKLVGLNPYILRLLKGTGAGNLIETYASTDEALRSFEGA